MLKKIIPQSLKNLYHLLTALFATIYFRFPARHLHIIGVTGTDGKTTTSTLIYHILKSANKRAALISTVAAYIDSDSIDTGFHVTSPDPWQLQKLLSDIRYRGIEYVVLEATSHGLDQHRLFATNPEMVVLTNITHEHLDYHRSMKRYARAKAKLFSQARFAIVERTSHSYELISTYISKKIKIISQTPEIPSYKIIKTIQKRFPEKYNQENAIKAVLVAKTLGIPDLCIISSINTFPQVKGRMESIKNHKKINLIVDFAHTPNALKNALEALRPQTPGKLIAVYGSAGLRDRQKRSVMGKIGSELADEVILTAEDPRTESVWSIIDQMSSNITRNISHVHKIPDRQLAVNFAVQIAKPGDTVAIFGKGHEKSMCIGTTEYPWSDQKAIKKAMRKARKLKNLEISHI